MRKVADLLDNIRNRMDTEFGLNQKERHRIVEDLLRMYEMLRIYR